MNKDEIISKISSKTGLSKRQAKAALDAAMDVIYDALGYGDSVHLHGFGRFQTRVTKKRIGRNLITKESVVIPPRVVPEFKPGSKLIDAAEKWGDSCVEK